MRLRLRLLMPRRNKALLLLAWMWAAAAIAQPVEAPPEPPPAPPKTEPKPAAPKVTTVTPVKERVLVVGALAKRTGQSRFFTLKPGQYIDFAGIRITARTCETTPPWEWQKLQGAFLQVDERLAGQVRRVFSGWLYAESPSLNVMEHPRYDVWLKNCTMRFPDGPKPDPSSRARISAPAETAADSKPR
jgi:hypothetical protein